MRACMMHARGIPASSWKVGRSAMAKNLVIVESPAKAKTINKFIGSDYIVKASVGHVRDLPKSKLGVDVDNDFEETYESLESRKKVIKELKDAAKDATDIYVATDPDREGEAIGWHLAEELDVAKKNVYRITFNEITERAVKAAFLVISLKVSRWMRRFLPASSWMRCHPIASPSRSGSVAT